MKHLFKHLTFLIIIVLFTGCNQFQQKEINELISGIRQKYVPDRRIALFDVHVDKAGQLAVEGETNVVAAFNELDSILKTDYPKVACKVICLPSESLGEKTWGIITISVANLRSIPGHSAELVTQALLGTPVKVLKKDNNWYLVQTPDSYLGWTTGGSISMMTEDEIRQFNNSERIIFTGMTGSCYQLPDEYSQPVSDLILGSILEVDEIHTRFFRVKFPDGRTGFVDKKQCLPLDIWKESFTYSPEKILKTAMPFLGLPYLWGGTSSKAVDCSGFTKTVFFMNGIILQRDASQQVLYGDLVNTSEDYGNLKPADLLFFGTHETDSTKERVTHVAIYIGNGEIIHSSGLVRKNSMIPGKENYSSYLDSIFIRAKRILTCVGESGIEPFFENDFYK
ncbi:MAG: hypothetical protein AMS27_01105 [Bacteroides sp. SM23_62_1]|nr:MAG: hypothetical protein AMS27_01105 [Bacteroides sp. SM23_62_1]